MTYDEAIAFWFGRINYEIRSAGAADLKLERMRALLRLLGDPHDRLRIIHVAGTKGKGSTAALLAAVLRAAGYRVGLFTSPHLVHVEERVQIDGVPITAAELAARMADIAVAVRAIEAGPLPHPTFFEISTALGFSHFVCRRVDVAIVEVGLGGRFDSTNVSRPVVSVVTSIGLDHTAQLGSTVEAIAFQKAGIIKPRVPVVSGVSDPRPADVIAAAARATGSRLVQAGRDFTYQYRASPTPAVRLGGSWYELRLLGEHQAANTAVTVATIGVLRDVGLTVPEAAVVRGLREVHWPARVEIVSRNPAVILDTAHNVPSAEALVATLRATLPATGRKSVVFAVSSDKQYPEMLRILAGYFDHFHLTRYGHNPRCVPPERLAEILHETAPARVVTVHPTAAEAWHAARSAASPNDVVCVTGSVFLAGELLSLVRPTP